MNAEASPGGAMAQRTPIRPGAASTGSATRPAQRRFRLAGGGLQFAKWSQRGTRGGVNEDAVLVAAPSFIGVADGVGGGARGEVASSVLLRHCAATAIGDVEAAGTWAVAADRIVGDALAATGEGSGAATLAACWLRDIRMLIAHVGDARAYVFQVDRTPSVRLLWRSRDQTYASEGLQTPAGGQEDDPACMIGSGCPGIPGVTGRSLASGQLLLLCTDGLHRNLSDEQLTRILASELAGGSGLEEMAAALARAAVNAASRDDITLAMVYRPFRFSVHPLYWTVLGVAVALAWLVSGAT